jgi:hypothetical protein
MHCDININPSQIKILRVIAAIIRMEGLKVETLGAKGGECESGKRQQAGCWIAGLCGGQLLESCPADGQHDELEVAIVDRHFVRVVVQVSMVALVDEVDVFGDQWIRRDPELAWIAGVIGALDRITIIITTEYRLNHFRRPNL